MTERRAAIAGTGLIGASIGLGLVEAGWQVAGWDPDDRVKSDAREIGALSTTSISLADLVASEPDLLILAGPIEAVIATLGQLDTDVLTVDVAGVKQPVVAAASHLPRFVGTHPMAGREISGPRAASIGLFRGAAWVVTTDGAAIGDLEELEPILESLGARPVRMTAAEHDAAVAKISHLPQLLAGALLSTVASDPHALALAAGSFRDLTRVAASDPVPWVGLLNANRAEVLSAATALRAELDRLAGELNKGDRDLLEPFLIDAQRRRKELAPPVVAVRVAVADQPGELAKVGRSLEASAVDVRDLQLRHAPYGGGGVLTLAVRPGDAETLRAALRREGLIVAD